MAEPETLSKGLNEAIDRLSDPDFAARIRAVAQACARVIGRLRDVDLLKYEKFITTGAPDLSLWEEVAPLVRDTVMDVNAALNAVRENFPAASSSDLVGAVGKAIEDTLKPVDDRTRMEQRQDEVSRRVNEIAGAIQAEVTDLGDRIRRPNVVSDAWNLMSDLQEFRGGFRRSFGEMVYAMITPFTTASKSALVPFYAEEVLQAVALRRAVTDLARVVVAHVRKAAGAGDAAVAEESRGLATNLDRFAKTRTFALLRAQDKRRIVEFRHYLERLLGAQVLQMVRAAMEDFARFCGSLAGISSRESLRQHDQQSLALVAVKLETAESKLDGDLAAASAALEEAATVAQGLYGRDGRLDEYLRQVARREHAPADPSAIRAEVASLRQLIAEIPVG